ncbi:MAG: tol-pal system YbgF family protein, partial [Planctomycetota bacterium]
MTRRLPSALLLAALLLCGAAPPMSAQVLGGRDLTPEEGVFLDKIINDYGYTDLARRWIAARKKSAGRVDKATLEFYTVDILRAEGEFEAADAENQRLARLFPGHPRSQGAELEAVQAVMARVLTMHQDALAETNPVARRKLLEERDRLFGSEVLGTLERAIPELEAALKTLRDPDPRRLSQKRAKKQLERDRWEHYRLQALKLYTQRLPEGSDEAAEGWQKLSELAELFVSERSDDFRMQYSAQLILGQALAAQGRSEEAAEALELLVEAEPVTAPPYSPGTIAFMRMLRIQALQGTAEAWNRAGRPERAVEAFDQAREGASRHFPLHADPEHPDLVPFVVLMDVEEAISRAGGGNRGRGVELFHRLIDRFDSPGFRRGDPLAAESYLEDIARGLSRLVDMQVGELGAELCFRAAVGFKLLGRYERAIGAAKQALHSGSGVPADTSWCARALYEIGENSDTLGRIPEAVIAYLALLDTYPQSPVAGDAARNAVALAADLAAAEGGIWRELAADAEKIFAGYSVGLASEQLKLQKGG